MDFVIYPAIDIVNGKCVRLHQGNYDLEKIYNEDPVSQALHFASAGARWIHVVDLDAARTGNPENREIRMAFGFFSVLFNLFKTLHETIICL